MTPTPDSEAVAAAASVLGLGVPDESEQDQRAVLARCGRALLDERKRRPAMTPDEERALCRTVLQSLTDEAAGLRRWLRFLQVG